MPDAIIVAPATYNTICKWAFGTSDTYALGILAEMTGMDIPVIVLPYVNAALASRAPFRRSVESLRNEGSWRRRLTLGAISPYSSESPPAFASRPSATSTDIPSGMPSPAWLSRLRGRALRFIWLARIWRRRLRRSA